MWTPCYEYQDYYYGQLEGLLREPLRSRRMPSEEGKSALLIFKKSKQNRVTCPCTKNPFTHFNFKKHVYMWNGRVSGKLCLSAIRFRGDVILQVSCYTFFKWIPTSVATILRSVSHRTPFRVYRKIGADIVKPSLSRERQVESLIASSAYQKWPTSNPRCTCFKDLHKSQK